MRTGEEEDPMTASRFGFAVALLALSCSALTLAQDNPNNVHQQTSTPPNARFEIVQSELVVRLTFRLDRFTGHVSQLVHTKEDAVAWQDTRVIQLPIVSSPSHARFQIFTSGIAGRHTFLIDTETGRTWIVW
jgi:hypothetical protein